MLGLAGQGHDPTYREIALDPGEVLLLRRYAHLLPALRATPTTAGTLWEALIEAHYDTGTGRWRLQLDAAGLAGLAHAAHLEALTGSVAVRERLSRVHGLTHPYSVPDSPLAEAAVGVVGLE